MQHSVLKEEKVKYGDKASAPSDPYQDNYKFKNWDKAFDYITEDTDIHAVYTKNDSNSNDNENSNGNVSGDLNNSGTDDANSNAVNGNLNGTINTNTAGKNSNDDNSSNNTDNLLQTGIYVKTAAIIMVFSLLVVGYCRYRKKN